jgi:hypothetical protein
MVAALSWNNRALDATTGAVSIAVQSGTYSTHAIDPTYPAHAVLDPEPSLVTRVNYVETSGGTARIRMEANWGTVAPVRALAALNVRLAPSVIAVGFAVTDAAGTVLEAPPEVAMADLVPIPGLADRYNLYAVLGQDRSAARVRLIVRVAPSSSDYYEVGHLWAAQAVVFQDGGDEGWIVQPIDPSDVTRGRGGMPLSTDVPRRQRLSIDLTARPYASLLGTPGNRAAPALRQMQREAGISRPVLAVHRSSDVHSMQVDSVYGALAELSGIEHQGGPYHRSAVVVEEIR